MVKMNKEQFNAELKKIGIELTLEQISKLDTYAQEIVVKNQEFNLTGITNYEQMLLKHFYDSLCIAKIIDLNGPLSILDIGSGAGFPGIVLNIVFPKINLTLLEANSKKARFLQDIINILKLTAVNVINNRAEEYFNQQATLYDIVTARAVAPLNILAELAMPFVKVDGYFIAMKGKIDPEIVDGQAAINILGGEIEEIQKYVLPFEESQRCLVKVKKIDSTNKMYPRRYDKIIKYPLKKE